MSSSRHDEPRRDRSDLPFLGVLVILGGLYLVLIVALLLADVSFLVRDIPPTSPGKGLGELWGHLARPLATPEIRYAIKLSLVSCTVTAILSLWFAVPLGYLLSRYSFPGKWLIDAMLDIPIVLPPLVIGLSLLILFQTRAGHLIEDVTQYQMGNLLTYGLLPLVLGLALGGVFRGLLGRMSLPGRLRWNQGDSRWTWIAPLAAAGLTIAVLCLTALGGQLSGYLQRHLGTPITYAIPSVILAQFSVACAFAVRTMRVTFDQLSPRQEQVALTLGCSRSQAFWRVVVPEARRGIITAAMLAWARALGEFGPILVFSGATRRRTEVLPTTVFLELSVGNLEAAVAVSLLMIAAAMAVLVIVRLWGMGPP